MYIYIYVALKPLHFSVGSVSRARNAFLDRGLVACSRGSAGIFWS